MIPAKGKYYFTSESVTEGHPDKVADRISDAILDTLLAQDPDSHVACETLVTTGMAMIAGEITTSGYADLPGVVRETIRNIGYTSSDWASMPRPAPSSLPSTSSLRISRRASTAPSPKNRARATRA